MTIPILWRAALLALLSLIVTSASAADQRTPYDAGSAAGSSGPAANQPPANQAPASPAIVSPADAPNPVEDAAITAKIKASLVADQATRTQKIDVDTKAGIVTLDGTVTSGAEALRAVQIARATEGVRAVTNNLRLH